MRELRAASIAARARSADFRVRGEVLGTLAELPLERSETSALPRERGAVEARPRGASDRPRDGVRALENEEISSVQRTLTVRSHLAILPARSASTQDARRRLRSRTRAAPTNRTDVLRARPRSLPAPLASNPRASRELPRRAVALAFADRSRLPPSPRPPRRVRRPLFPVWKQGSPDRSGSHPMGSARTLRASSPSSIPITLDATHRPPRAIEPLRACLDRP